MINRPAGRRDTGTCAGRFWHCQNDEFSAIRKISHGVNPCGKPSMFAWLQRVCGRGSEPATPAARRGAEGERLAAEFLCRRLGYEMVTANWRNPRNRREEIDLVCRDGEALVFVEVKTRDADALVQGYQAVDRRKRKVLRRAIRAYLTRLRHRPKTFRFDVAEVAVDDDGSPPEVRHYENVRLFPKNRHGMW